MPQAAPEQPVVGIEQTLRDLARVGTLVKDRGYRQVWRFEHQHKAYYLKFYPRGGFRDRWRRRFRGSPAAREFFRLQWLQKAAIPAPRAVAYLAGFRLQGRAGDAVILEAIEPSVPLDEYLNQRELEGKPVAEHRQLADALIELVYALGKAGLGHDDLHLGNFLLHNGKVYLIDAYAVRKGGLRQADVLQLGASVSRFATTTDLLRGWRRFGGGEPGVRPPPENNPVSRQLWAASMARVKGNNRYVGRLAVGGWRGLYFRKTKHPRRWSVASQLNVTDEDWHREWPILQQQIEGDTLPVLKRSASGDVLAGRVTLAGRELDVVIKRPRRRYWYRYLNEVGRGARPRRAWAKSWHLIVRNLPTAWPLAVFERRQLGYVTDTVFITERVPGPTLWQANLDAMGEEERDMLFRRTGRILRLIERYGFSHFDAKASNWIVREDDATGPAPVLIDADGVRKRRWVALGIERLLRSLREKPQYTPEDSLALCRGYAPYARLKIEGEATPAPPDEPNTAGGAAPP